MTFVYDALRDKPQGLWQMDDTSPFQDYSGYSRSATASGGTPLNYPALCYGATFAQIFTNTVTGQFSSNVFKQGYEKDPFTLMAWARPIEGTAGEQQILGNSGQMDGLVWNGTTISFVTKFSTTGEARCSYDCQFLKNVFIVGTHTRDKNSLYINGILVDEQDITETQQADTFVATSSNLISGTTGTTKKIAVNGVGIYGNALTAESVARMFVQGRRRITGDTVVSVYKGTRYPLSQNMGDVFLDALWTTNEDWNNATKQSIIIQDDQLRPVLNAGTSIRGEWIDTIPLQTDATSVYGVVIDWDGEGATVSASVDGTTWATATKGKNISVVPNGYNPQNKELNIKVVFPGGIVDDPAFVDNITVTGLKTGIQPKIDGRTVTIANPASIKREFVPMEMHDNWGVEIETGSITISTSDEPNPVNPRTIGMWVKRTSATALTLSFSGQAYVRGTAVTQAVATPVGEWSLVYFVMGSAVTGAITISGSAIIGEITLFEDAKTTTQLAEMDKQYIGPVIQLVGDNSVIAMSEPATSAVLYAQEWSITGAR